MKKVIIIGLIALSMSSIAIAGNEATVSQTVTNVNVTATGGKSDASSWTQLGGVTKGQVSMNSQANVVLVHQNSTHNNVIVNEHVENGKVVAVGGQGNVVQVEQRNK